MNKQVFYAIGEHDRDDLPWPLRADRWMWRQGGSWAAVLGDWHTDWWDGASPREVAARPGMLSLPIAVIPTSGTLAYLDRAGHLVEEAAPICRRRSEVSVARAIAVSESGPQRVQVVQRRESHPLVIHGLSRQDSIRLKHVLPLALRASDYQMPGGHLIVTVTGQPPRSASCPGIDLAVACALLAADRTLNAERLATHALHGTLLEDGSLQLTGTLEHLAAAAYQEKSYTLLAPSDPAETRPPLLAVATLSDAVRLLQRGPLPAFCPACGSAPRLLGGDQLVTMRQSAPPDTPAQEAMCDDQPGWRCANVHCTHFACYLEGSPAIWWG